MTINFHLLDAIYQRTQSESKSQPATPMTHAEGYWMQSIKEHNLKANHNNPVQRELEHPTGCNLSKNTIWKQITTRASPLCQQPPLDAIYQRTQSESKSQQGCDGYVGDLHWMQSIKEHNLKANHNSVNILEIKGLTGCNLSKNTIWKQITTKASKQQQPKPLDAIYQRTQSESKSQPRRCNLPSYPHWMQSIKEHNLKANHNLVAPFVCITLLDAIYQRTQSESKSQHTASGNYDSNNWMQSIKEHNLKANHNDRQTAIWSLYTGCNLSKNTIWKQITTFDHAHNEGYLLDAIYQRTQSESKSQHFIFNFIFIFNWMQSIKEHNLKANHNSIMFHESVLFTGCNLSKNTIWKQITTRGQMAARHGHWMQSIKEHNLKANHNTRGRNIESTGTGCNLSKNTIWKQITTGRAWFQRLV